MGVKGWWILQDEDKLRRPADRKIGLRHQRTVGEEEKKDAKTWGMCRRKWRNCTDKIYGREVDRRLPPTRIIERNDR